MSKTARTLSGIWDNVSMAAGKEGAKLSTQFQASVNEYRDNPTEENRKAMAEADGKFFAFWGPIHDKMVNSAQAIEAEKAIAAEQNQQVTQSQQSSRSSRK